MNKYLEYLKLTYKDDLLFVGLRGSHCLNLQTKNSDIDLLVVVSDNYSNAKMQDINILNLSTFKKGVLKVNLEIVEAISNEIYVKNDFEDIIYKIKTIFESGNESIQYLFWYQLWSALKNQIKQFYKNERKNKFLSRTLLWGNFLKEKDCINYWIRHKAISQEQKYNYFRIKNNYKITEDDLRKLEVLWLYRTNDDNRKYYRELYNKHLKKSENIFNSLLK